MKKKKPTKEKSNVAPVRKNSTPPEPEQEENKLFDFGGLPDRNLKKNLGCG